MGGVASNSYNQGCESIGIIAANFAQLQDVTNCLMNKVNMKAANGVYISQVNSVVIEEGGSLKCKTFNQDNKLEGVIGMKTEMSADIKNCISDMMKVSLANSMKNMQEDKSGYGATPKGERVYQDIGTNLQKYIQSEAINEVMETVLNTVKANQKNQLVIGKGASMTVEEACNQTNDMLIKVQISTLMSTAIQNMFETQELTEFKNQMEEDQKSQAAGMDSIFGLAFLLPILIIGGTVLFGGAEVNNVMKYIVPIGLVITIILAIVFAMRKDWVLTGIDAAAFVGLLIFMYFSVKKSKQGSVNVPVKKSS
jgi:hypothetical protein